VSARLPKDPDFIKHPLGTWGLGGREPSHVLLSIHQRLPLLFRCEAARRNTPPSRNDLLVSLLKLLDVDVTFRWVAYLSLYFPTFSLYLTYLRKVKNGSGSL